MAALTNKLSINRNDLQLAKDMKERLAFDALQLSASDQENRRNIWQKVFLQFLPSYNRADRVQIASGIADEAVAAYDKKFGL